MRCAVFSFRGVSFGGSCSNRCFALVDESGSIRFVSISSASAAFGRCYGDESGDQRRWGEDLSDDGWFWFCADWRERAADHADGAGETGGSAAGVVWRGWQQHWG